jgi:hypothetical protein
MNGNEKTGSHGHPDGCLMLQGQDNVDHTLMAINRAEVAVAAAASIGMAVVDWQPSMHDPRRPPGLDHIMFIGDDYTPVLPTMTAVVVPATG